ncbi:hypothetical protein NliqN6_4442 [Naganishia liquefaciens]|uniref:Uncharacterized protein n=1 Tax=Naganishia liquefaciens TaxID=104408 RepID=A0A8H3TVK7_9TREE|nr:hypothetical protein NliqN6_4442 [Naganishia liquefaciens]
MERDLSASEGGGSRPLSGARAPSMFTYTQASTIPSIVIDSGTSSSQQGSINVEARPETVDHGIMLIEKPSGLQGTDLVDINWLVYCLDMWPEGETPVISNFKAQVWQTCDLLDRVMEIKHLQTLSDALNAVVKCEGGPIRLQGRGRKGRGLLAVAIPPGQSPQETAEIFRSLFRRTDDHDLSPAVNVPGGHGSSIYSRSSPWSPESSEQAPFLHPGTSLGTGRLSTGSLSREPTNGGTPPRPSIPNFSPSIITHPSKPESLSADVRRFHDFQCKEYNPKQLPDFRGFKFSFWVFDNENLSPLETRLWTGPEIHQKLRFPKWWLQEVRREWFMEHRRSQLDKKQWPPIKVCHPDESKSWILYPSWHGQVTLQTASKNVQQRAFLWEPSKELKGVLSERMTERHWIAIRQSASNPSIQ